MNLPTRRPYLRSTLWLPHASLPKKGNFLTTTGFNITGRKAAIVLTLSGLLSLVYGAGQVLAASAPTINGPNPTTPLSIVLVSDAVSQAELVCAAAAEDTITIIYQSDSMTTSGLVDLLASVSTAHHGARIDHLGVTTHGGPGKIYLVNGDVLRLETMPSHAALLERLRSVPTNDLNKDAPVNQSKP